MRCTNCQGCFQIKGQTGRSLRKALLYNESLEEAEKTIAESYPAGFQRRTLSSLHSDVSSVAVFWPFEELAIRLKKEEAAGDGILVWYRGAGFDFCCRFYHKTQKVCSAVNNDFKKFCNKNNERHH